MHRATFTGDTCSGTHTPGHTHGDTHSGIPTGTPTQRKHRDNMHGKTNMHGWIYSWVTYTHGGDIYAWGGRYAWGTHTHGDRRTHGETLHIYAQEWLICMGMAYTHRGGL